MINNQNGKIYIGKTQGKLILRIRRHCHEVLKGTNRYIYDAIRHYGWENFNVDVVEVCSNIDELNEREIYWISILKSNVKDFGYNLTIGGDGSGFSQEALKKSADIRRGKPLSEETKKKISEGNKGKIVFISEETKRKISSSLKGRMPQRPIHEIMKGKPGARLGAKHTEESKKLMSLHQTGLSRWSEEQKKQMSINRVGEGNTFWKTISKDELILSIKNGLTLYQLADKFVLSAPTILNKIKYLLGYSGLKEARKNLIGE